MKTRLSILILLTISIMVPVTSFAEKHSVCNFGDESTPAEYLFENDFAVKAFFEMHPDATQTLVTDKSGNHINQIAVQFNDGVIKETLMLKFNVDTKGCYIPAYYDYLYDDGDIGPQVRNSASNFTEIVDLIRTEHKTIDDFYPDGCQFVDLDVLMTSGKSFGVCKKTASNGVTILVDSASSGSLEIDLPIQMVYSLPSKDCKPTGDFLVLMEDGETSYEITPTDIGNRVRVEFSEGFHKIQILGTVIIPNPSPAQYCGIVEGYLDKQYLAPLDQTDHGVAAKSVRCNDGLTLIQKHNGFPACVKPTSVIDLIKRNWLTTDEIDGYAIDYDGDVKHLPFADVCTNEMKIILLTHSNIASPEEHFVMDDVALPSGMNQEDFENCAVATDFTKERWNMAPRENEQEIDWSNITLMKPNSMEFFYYPDPEDTNDTHNLFMLIRLPEWMGGAENDVSAFRAYSAKALDDPCIVKYWSDVGRQRIENPCQGGMYRVIDGALTYGAIHMSTAMTALPYLELSIDNNGMMYVEPPTFTPSENGVIAYGRNLTLDEIRENSEFLVESFAKHYPKYPPIPTEFAGYTLSEITPENHFTTVRYLDFPNKVGYITMIVGTGTTHPDFSKSDVGYWQIGDTEIKIAGTAMDEDSTTPESFRTYEITFRDGYYYKIEGKNLEFLKKSTVSHFFPDFEYDDLILISDPTE